MRWEGLGDYFPAAGDVKLIYVARTGNELYDRLLAIHELIEDTALFAAGTDVRDVDAWCDSIYCMGGNPSGDSPDSPAHREHIFAERIELMVADKCGVLEDYQNHLDGMLVG